MEQDNFGMKELCVALEVSRSGFYAHGRKSSGKRRVEDANLSLCLGQSFRESRRTYGTRRLQKALRAQGRRCARRRIARLMAQSGLQAIGKRRYRPRTTDSRHDHPIATNRLLEGAQDPALAHKTWVADITYLPTGEGWHYLAAEMNLASRRIVGWKTGPTLQSTLVEAAFRRAAFSTPPPQLHHSDRGCQYASTAFRSLLRSHNVTASMSRKANCYDNATMESFWATLKAECFHAGPPATRADADRMLFDYIESFYNTRRLHSSLGYRSPADYEKSFNLNSTQSN